MVVSDTIVVTVLQQEFFQAHLGLGGLRVYPVIYPHLPVADLDRSTSFCLSLGFSSMKNSAQRIVRR